MRAERAASDIRRAASNGNVIVKQLDLASLQSVRDFAQHIIKTEPELHILINNAGD